MKIFPSSSIKKLDAYTIEHEPIASIDLMERAATALTKAIMNRWSRETPVTVFAGPGNNGGDALAVARMLSEKGYKTEVYLFNPKGELSRTARPTRNWWKWRGSDIPRNQHPIRPSHPDTGPLGYRRAFRFGTEQTVERRIRSRCEIHQFFSGYGSSH